jgi:formylglycine-generating enzyme required for sulfatase activity
MKAFIGMISFCFLLLGFSSNDNFKKKDKTPPGTVRLNDSLFIDRAEAANVHWREFLYWLEMVAKDSNAMKQNLPDTLAWKNDWIDNSDAYTEYYFRHPSYNNYPIVGVSYEQAIAYCKWRSDRVNELYVKNPKQNPFPNKKYRYRLPSKVEWELAASGKMDITIFPFGYTSVYDKKYKTLHDSLGITVNSKEKATSGEHGMYRPAMIAISDAWFKNNNGCYNMIGNVSEMVSTKGIAKGGNFLLPLDSCKIKLEQHYTEPEAWLGFRCVCEIVN